MYKEKKEDVYRAGTNKLPQPQVQQQQQEPHQEGRRKRKEKIFLDGDEEACVGIFRVSDDLYEEQQQRIYI